MTTTTRDGDLAARTTLRRRLRSPLLVMIVGLTVALVAALLHVATVKKELERTRLAWAGNCKTAKSSAIGSLHSAVLEGRYIRARYPEAEIPLSGAGPGNALAVYVWACAPRGDYGTRDMSMKIGILTLDLLSTQDLDALEKMEGQLEATPLEQWKSLKLPANPSVFLMTARGNQQEADDIERKYEAALQQQADETDGTAKVAAGRDAATAAP